MERIGFQYNHSGFLLHLQGQGSDGCTVSLLVCVCIAEQDVIVKQITHIAVKKEIRFFRIMASCYHLTG